MESNPSESSSPAESSSTPDAPITAEPPIVREEPTPSEAPSMPTSLPPDDVAAIDELGKSYKALKAELGKVIIGQQDVVEHLLVTLLVGGHCLITIRKMHIKRALINENL